MEDEVENTEEYVIGEIKRLLERETPDQLIIILRILQNIVK